MLTKEKKWILTQFHKHESSSCSNSKFFKQIHSTQTHIWKWVKLISKESLASKFIKFCELVFWLFNVKIFMGPLSFPPQHWDQTLFEEYFFRAVLDKDSFFLAYVSTELHYSWGLHRPKFSVQFPIQLIWKSFGLAESIFCSVKISVTICPCQTFFNAPIFISLFHN